MYKFCILSLSNWISSLSDMNQGHGSVENVENNHCGILETPFIFFFLSIPQSFALQFCVIYNLFLSIRICEKGKIWLFSSL